MKTAKLFLTVFFSALMMVTVNGQDSGKKPSLKTEEIKVLGSCGMCKTRIEKAAKAEGVTEATWNSETKMLKVTYNPSVITIDAIQKKEAAVGHDTEKYRADNDVYAKLPACCHYERWK